MAKEQNYTIRLKVEGGKVVTADLNQIGETGEKSMLRLNKATAGAATGFDALGSIVKGRLLAILGPAALGAAIKSTISHLAELNDTAERTGIAVEKLQELRFAAVQVGEATGVMDDALFNFTEKVGAAQGGMGKLLPILKELNIQLTEGGQNRAAVDIMRDYLDAIRNVQDPQTQLFLAQKAFGDDAGRRLIEVWRQGAEGVDNYAASAQAAGVIIDKELIAKADAIEEQFAQMAYVIEAKLIIALGGLNDKMDDLAGTFRAGLLEAKNYFDYLVDAYDGISPLAMLDPSTRDAAKARMAENLARMNGPQPDPSLFESNGDPNGPLIPGYGGTPKTKTKFSLDKDGSGSAARAAASLKKQIEDLQFRNLQLTRTAEEQELYNQLRQAGVDITSKEGQEIRALVDEYNILTEAQKKQAEEIKKGEEAAKKYAEAWDNGLDRIIDAFDDGKITMEEFGQAAMQLIKDLIMSQQNSSEDSIFSSIATSFAGGGGSGGGIMDFFSSLWPFEDGGVMSGRGPLPLRKYRRGGIADGPQLAMFGEGEMNEAYVPLPDGRSIPVTLDGAGGGFGQVTINNYGAAKVTTSQQRKSNGQRELIVQLDEANEKLISDPGSRTARAMRKSGNLTQ